MIAWDTETFLIGQAQAAPRLVCVSFYDGHEAGVVHVNDPACRRIVEHILDNPMVGQNIPFDLAVVVAKWPDLLEKVFSVYDIDRVCDTMVRQKLIDIAKGEFRGYKNAATRVWVEHKYHLADLAKRHGYAVDLDKDTWRLRYNELIDTPVSEWPEGAVSYSEHDARSTYHVWEKQEGDAEYLLDQYRQSRYHWALHLISVWGIRTDEAMVRRFEEVTRAILDDHEKLLFAEDLIYRKKDGTISKRVKKAQEIAFVKWAEQGREDDMVKTEGGAPSLSEDAAVALGDPLITAFQEYSGASNLLQRVEEVKVGVHGPIHTRFDELMASGRTSSSKPNIQARKVEPIKRASCGHHVNRKKSACPECGTPYQLAGDRECFVPREGCVFYIWDVPGLELRTIAQKCKTIIGYSRLADILNANEDPHLVVGANLLGISYEEAKKRKKDPADTEIYLARQTGKIVNFGLDALLGWRGLIEQARTKYDMVLTPQEAKYAIEVYYESYPEQREFREWVQAQCSGGAGTIEQLFSQRTRGMLQATEASNTISQGLGADATKSALYSLVRHCYVGNTVLQGSRVVNYVHDEYITEGPEDDRMVERGEFMVRSVLLPALNEWIPDVPVPYEPPTYARRWSKMAKANGQVWEWDLATKLGSRGHALAVR